MKLDRETRMTISVLARNGQSGRAIARMLGVTENTVRYHLQRQATAAIDGRTRQEHKADSSAAAIAHYLENAGDGPVNLASLHEWLIAEHDFTGSLRGLQRYFRRHFPKPAVRARRRVETPPGAQAQADWADWPRVWIAGRPVYAYQLPTSSTCGSRTAGSGRGSGRHAPTSSHGTTCTTRASVGSRASPQACGSTT